jgi:hypothetical protein
MTYELRVTVCIFGGYCECKKIHAMNRIKLDVTVKNILALAPGICVLLK